MTRIDNRSRLYAVFDGTNYTKSYRQEGKGYLTKEYALWHNMFNRCRASKDACYDSVKLDKRFEDYNFFVDWVREQVGFNEVGWCLDKDILCFGKDKVYSPETCVFIPPILNSFLTFRKSKANSSGYCGVSYQKSSGKYIVSCAELNGSNKTLGRFNDPLEGYQAYKNHKIKLSKILLKTYSDELDVRVVDFLKNFSRNIDLMAIYGRSCVKK